MAQHRVGAFQVARQAWVGSHEAGIAEGVEHAPQQPAGVEGRAVGNARHDAGDLPPQPLRQEVELDVGADAVRIGDGQAQVAAHRGVRHDHLLRGRTRRRCAVAQALHQLLAQRLQAVGKVEVQHAGVGGSLCAGVTNENRGRMPAHRLAR